MTRAKTVNNWLPWCKPALAICSAALLTSYAPLPGLLDQIKALGELRVVTRTGPLAFYRGADDMPQGPEYELAHRFADELGVRLTMIPVGTTAQIYAALRSGTAHLAAAGLKIPVRALPGIEFGPSYQRVSEHMIYLHGANRPDSPADMQAGELAVAAGMAHIPQSALVDPRRDTLSLLDAVAAGRLRYTVADSTEFALAHDLHPELRVAFDLESGESLGWAMRGDDPAFAAEVRRFFARLKGDGGLTAIVNRYYGRTENPESGESAEFMRRLRSRLPLYRRWFEEAGLQSSEDWRLLAAIGYQESKWDPRAANPSGARGLMQLTRQTADEADVADPGDARESIFGGARYFREVHEKIPTHVPEPDRTFFALAAYNIGYARLEEARVAAQRAGRDPDSWREVRDYLPGNAPARYVENVRGYRDLLEWVWGSPVALN